jgi:preprotein translocase subunit SecG
MRRARIIAALLVITIVVLALAPAALASSGAGVNGGGQGWYGETSDKVITNAMFLVIIFFPAVGLIFSLIQGRLDKRKHVKMDAAKRRAASADWRGGW